MCSFYINGKIVGFEKKKTNEYDIVLENIRAYVVCSFGASHSACWVNRKKDEKLRIRAAE